jgi:hypothetical protein
MSPFGAILPGARPRVFAALFIYLRNIMARSPSRTSSLTKARVGDALIEARGIITATAAILGCSPQTIRRMLERHPDLILLRAEARAFMLEEAEEQLLKKAREGNVTACVFLCRTLGAKQPETSAAKPVAAAPEAISEAALQQALDDIEDEC